MDDGQMLQNVSTYIKSVLSRALALCGDQYELDLLQSHYTIDEIQRVFSHAIESLEERLGSGDTELRRQIGVLQPHLETVMFLITGEGSPLDGGEQGSSSD